jgi:hypothetical protein
MIATFAHENQRIAMMNQHANEISELNQSELMYIALI